MGTSRSAAELADKFSRLAAEVPHANRDAIKLTSKAAEGVFVAGAVRAGLRPGGNLPAHGRAKWGARSQLGTSGTTSFIGSSTATGAHVAAMVTYVGPVHWAIYGTSGHIIGARGRGTRRQWKSRYGQSVIRGAVGATGGRSRSKAKALDSGGYGVRKRGAKALSFGGRFATYATHPGANGRNTWPQTKKRVQELAPREFHRAHRDALRRARF